MLKIAKDIKKVYNKSILVRYSPCDTLYRRKKYRINNMLNAIFWEFLMIHIHHLKRSLGFIAAIVLVFIKIGVFSSYAMLTLSFNNCFIPALGVIFGSSSLVFYFVLKTAIHLFHTSSWYSFLSSCSLPSLGAGLYLTNLDQSATKKKKSLLSGLILSCMILFISQTYTSCACFYSCFWLIPLLAIWLPYNSLFIRMLGSVFTAHAIGSNLWLFFGPTLLPAQWIALIPIVIVERIILATGMFIIYQIVNPLASLLVRSIQHIVSYRVG